MQDENTTPNAEGAQESQYTPGKIRFIEDALRDAKELRAMLEEVGGLDEVIAEADKDITDLEQMLRNATPVVEIGDDSKQPKLTVLVQIEVNAPNIEYLEKHYMMDDPKLGRVISIDEDYLRRQHDDNSFFVFKVAEPAIDWFDKPVVVQGDIGLMRFDKDLEEFDEDTEE